MARIVYCKWWLSDWLSSETRLSMTAAERGVYRDALDLNYQEGSLPSNEIALQRLLCVTPEEFAQCWPTVARKFQSDSNGRLVNSRVLQVLKDDKKYSRKQSERAKQRWHSGDKPADEDGDATAMPPHSERNAGAMPAHESGNATAMPPQPQPQPSPKPHQKSKTVRPTGASQPPVDESLPDAPDLVAIWNAECGTLPKVHSCGKSRHLKIKARLNGSKNGAFAEQFRPAVRKSQAVPFLQGDNDRGWRLSFDFLVANEDNVGKVLEGVYDGIPAKRLTAHEANAELFRKLEGRRTQ